MKKTKVMIENLHIDGDDGSLIPIKLPKNQQNSFNTAIQTAVNNILMNLVAESNYSNRKRMST